MSFHPEIVEVLVNSYMYWTLVVDQHFQHAEYKMVGLVPTTKNYFG